MTIAEKIENLKTQEAQAFERYMNAVLKEVNALCKRLGMDETNYSEVQRAYSFTLKCEDEEIKVHHFQVPMLTAIVRIVKALPYIVRIHDKWSDLSRKLEHCKDLLK